VAVRLSIGGALRRSAANFVRYFAIEHARAARVESAPRRAAGWFFVINAPYLSVKDRTHVDDPLTEPRRADWTFN
jgi:hypothetical protein